MVNSVNLIYFSPTGTTKKIVESIAEGLNYKTLSSIDITSSRKTNYSLLEKGLTVIGVPVYGGRIPVVAAERLKKIKVNNKPAVLVAVYGNRNYDDTLIELKDLAIELGFIPIAAAAFVAEHSYSTDKYPISVGRPDSFDLEKAFTFGKEVGLKVGGKIEFDKVVKVPGNFPYKALGEKPDISPVNIESKCNKCGICETVCPTGSIHMDGFPVTDSATCILCCACIKSCPENARENNNSHVLRIQEWLINNCTTRKEPDFYFI